MAVKVAGVWPWERVLVFVPKVPHGLIPEGISVHCKSDISTPVDLVPGLRFAESFVPLSAAVGRLRKEGPFG